MDSRQIKQERGLEMTEEEIDAIYESQDGKMYISDTLRELFKIVFRSHKDDSIEILKLKFSDRGMRLGRPYVECLEDLVGLKEKGYTEEQLVLMDIKDGKDFDHRRLIQFPTLGLGEN